MLWTYKQDEFLCSELLPRPSHHCSAQDSNEDRVTPGLQSRNARGDSFRTQASCHETRLQSQWHSRDLTSSEGSYHAGRSFLDPHPSHEDVVCDVGANVSCPWLCTSVMGGAGPASAGNCCEQCLCPAICPRLLEPGRCLVTVLNNL